MSDIEKTKSEEATEPVVEDKKEEATTAESITEPEATTAETTTTEATTAITTAPEESTAPPPKPPRPLSPKEKAKKTLKEAFPDVEDKYITMVLIASKGDMESAFSALLYLNDPSVEQEIVIQPVSEQKPKLPSRNKQLESDEALARRLAREYERQSGGGRRSSGVNPSGRSGSGRRRQTYEDDDDDEDVLDRFLEKDLPQMKEQFNKNVEEARVKLGGWLGGIKQKINAQTEGGNSELFSAFGGNRSSSEEVKYTRPRRDYADETSEVGSHGIILQDNESKEEKKLPDPPKEDIYGTPTTPKTVEPAPTKPEEPKKNKWEPLKSVQPEPVSNDTFLVTDSEEEEEDKTK